MCLAPTLALLSSSAIKPLLILCLGAPLLLAAVVEVTAEAGVAPDSRCAEFTVEMRTVHLRAHNSEEDELALHGRQDPLGLEM